MKFLFDIGFEEKRTQNFATYLQMYKRTDIKKKLFRENVVGSR